MFDRHFTKQLEIKLTVAMIGVSKKRWEFVADTLQNKETVARDKMIEKRFDVLPVVKKNGKGELIESYFFTKEWNKFDEIEELRITNDDLIDFQTDINDLVKLFAINSRKFYFLKSKNKIVGLVSLVNLNAKEVRIYLYGLICELEILLRDFISQNLNEEDLFEIIKANNKEKEEIAVCSMCGAEKSQTENLFSSVLDNYNKDRKNGIDDNIIEYLYLTQFITIITQKNLYEQIGFNSKKSFEKKFKSLNEVRKPVAHPTRSLIKSANDIKKLYERLEKLKEGIDKLRNCF